MRPRSEMLAGSPGLGRGIVGLASHIAQVIRIHDLRHSFASIAVSGGDSLYLVGKVLGHRQARTTERYAHLKDDPLRAVADRTAGTIAAMLEGDREDEVVSMKSR